MARQHRQNLMHFKLDLFALKGCIESLEASSSFSDSFWGVVARGILGLGAVGRAKMEEMAPG